MSAFRYPLWPAMLWCEMVKTDQRHSLGTTSLLPPQISKYVLVRYLVLIRGVASRVQDLMKRLIDPRKPYLTAWIRIHDVDWPPVSRPREGNYPTSKYPHRNASCKGLHRLEDCVGISPMIQEGLATFGRPLIDAKCSDVRFVP